MVVRPSGSVLAVDFSAPNIFDVAVDAGAEPRLIHTFPNTTGVSGIAEASADTYFVVTGNFSFANFSSIAGSYSVHQLTFDGCTDQAAVSFIGDVPILIQPNGILSIPNTPYLLIADSIAGKVYRYDTEKRAISVYFDHPLLQPSGTSLQTGVNGLKFSRGYLYFSNTDQELVARVRVSGLDRVPLGDPEVVASQTLVDDFVLNDFNGNIYLAENGLSKLACVRGRGDGTVPEVLAGASNSTELAGPTAAVWAKGGEGKKLIVSSTGGLLGYLSGTHQIGGQISLINVDGRC